MTLSLIASTGFPQTPSQKTEECEKAVVVQTPCRGVLLPAWRAAQLPKAVNRWREAEDLLAAEKAARAADQTACAARVEVLTEELDERPASQVVTPWGLVAALAGAALVGGFVGGFVLASR